MIKRKYVIGLILVWGIVLIGFIAFKQCTLQTGTEIMLKTVPVDPRDLFRGDYVVLRYDLNTIHLDSLLADEGPYERDETIYVKLDNSSSYAKATQVSKNRFEEGLFIKGTVTYAGIQVLNVKYGIENYFVPQGTGKEIEKIIGDIDVIIAVDKQGNALIKSLQYEGKKL